MPDKRRHSQKEKRKRSIAERAMLEAYERLYKHTNYGKASQSHSLVISEFPIIWARGIRSIFEVGAGRGVIMRAAMAHGFRPVVGTEPCDYLRRVDLARFQVYPWTISNLDGIDDLSYDLVVSVDVLDHLVAPSDEDELLDHSFRIARIGCLHVIGGSKSMRTNTDSAELWASRMRKKLQSEPQIIRSSRSPAVMICAWFFKNS